jgi:hypothetical protein
MSARSIRRRAVVAIATAAVIASVAPLATVSARSNGGFLTSRPAMLDPLVDGVNIKPLISVGDRVGNYTFQSIPDGIAIDPRGRDSLNIYVNHETSTVPFLGFADARNAELSRLTLGRGSGKVTSGALVIDTTSNYLRFCSNFFAGSAQGFSRNLVLTNEETNDLVNRTGTAWPATAGAEQAGVVVAYDPATGQHRSIYGLGRMNHENAVAIPGLSQITIGTTDDTFVSNPPNSQFYLYTAANADAVWNDTGKLWAFKSDNDAIDDYYDITTQGTTIAGHFIEVPRAVAIGDQNALETWNQDPANHVFDFVRLEDLAYDRTQPGVLYIADTGRGSGAAPNGRIWKMTLHEQSDGIHADLTLMLNFDPAGIGVASSPHQPDNVETTATDLYFTEDPSTGNQFTVGTGTPARVWRYTLAGAGAGTLTPVLAVDQSLDEAAGDVDTTPADRWGTWEASGIVDASRYFGAGAFLVNVQAHSRFLSLSAADASGNRTKVEDGQLLLVRFDSD